MSKTQQHVDRQFSAKCADMNNSGTYDPFGTDRAVFVPCMDREGMKIESDTNE